MTVRCRRCNNPIIVVPSKLKKRVYCSRECQHFGKRESIKCHKCGKEFANKISSKRKFCSSNCANSFNYSLPRSHRTVVNGYVHIFQPHHPFADSRGYVREHHLVMEKLIKRFIVSPEVIHHINHITDDNRVENLELFKDNREHMLSRHRRPKNRQ